MLWTSYIYSFLNWSPFSPFLFLSFFLLPSFPFLPPSLPPFLPSFLPSCLPAFLPSSLPSSLPFSIFPAFFPLPFSPHYPTPPSDHHPVVHVHESFALFAQSLHSLTCPTPHHSCHLLSISESVSLLLVSSVCSLDSTNEWNHMVFVFLWLAYFT